MRGYEMAPAERPLVEQFDDPERMDFGSDKINVVDIAPEKLKSEIPTIIVPGFSATSEALKDAIIRTAEAGRRVISVEAAHGIDTTEKRTDLPDAELRKLELFLQLIEKKGLDKVNVICNSESAIYVTAAALLYPEKFQEIVYSEPAGLVGKHEVPELMKRFIADAVEQGRQDKGKKKLEYPSPMSTGAKSVLFHPGQSLAEVEAIAGSDIAEDMGKVHASGIGVSIIHAVDDKIFPMEKVQEMVKANMVDGFYSVTGTHNSIYMYEPYGRAAEAALSALELKRAMREAREDAPAEEPEHAV